MRYTERLWSLRYPVLLLVVMQAFDTLSTMLALGAGAGAEGNPLVVHLLDHGGGALVLAKWAVVALVFIAIAIDPLEQPYVKAAIMIMNVVYGIVLSSNFLAYALATDAWALPVAWWALACALAAAAFDEARHGGRPDGGAGSSLGPKQQARA